MLGIEPFLRIVFKREPEIVPSNIEGSNGLLAVPDDMIFLSLSALNLIKS
jgi:hypothetical protein